MASQDIKTFAVLNRLALPRPVLLALPAMPAFFTHPVLSCPVLSC
jgi:hypothetical protein